MERKKADKKEARKVITGSKKSKFFNFLKVQFVNNLPIKKESYSVMFQGIHNWHLTWNTDRYFSERNSKYSH